MSAGAVFVARGVMAWHVTRRARPTRPNTQFALRVVVPLDGATITFADAAGREHETASPIVIPAGTPYATRRGGPRLGLTLHPLLDGRAIANRMDGPTILESRSAGRVRAIARDVIEGASEPHALQGDLFAALGGSLGPLVDRRVRRTLDVLASEEPVRATELARRLALSPDHLRHLVVAEVGVTIRHLARWLRFVRAVEALWQPASLAHVAATAGFADQAHLTRTCRDAVGHPPSLRSEVTVNHLAPYYPRAA
jgi:AraC-like DNA-binding protein